MSEKIEVPELGAVGLARYLWRQLTSMRTALILLMMMGIAAIPGSLIPQRITNAIAVRDLYDSNPNLARWYDRFYLFDLYGSPWFSAIYILLFISLIGCVLPRTLEHYKAMKAQPPATPRNLSRLEHHQEFKVDDAALERAASWFAKNRFRIKRDGDSISAEKGYLRETGNLLFHLSLILILVGVSFGALFGMRGEAIINVGERFINVATTYDTLSFGKLTSEKSLQPFEVKLDRFNATYNPATNAPIDYKAWVTVTENGISRKQILKVNQPLTFGNTKVYLQANGYSPVVTVRDSRGNVALQGPVPFLPQDANLRSIGAIKVPDADPPVRFRRRPVGIGQGKFIRQLVARVCRLMVVRLRSDVFECSIDELGASFFLGVCGVDGPGDARLVWFRYGLAPFVTCYVASGLTALYMKRWVW